MRRDKISNNVIRRLPRYLRKMEELGSHGVERISSSELGRQLGLTPSQIRQDFSCFGEFGQQGYGYNVNLLRQAISSILGLSRGYSVVILGVGNLGRALIENFDFAEHGFRLNAAFDISPELIGGEHFGVKIYSVDELGGYIEKFGVDIAVLTVPKQAANQMANYVAGFGARSIWNFTNIELELETPGVIVEDIHFLDSLMALSYYLTEVVEAGGEEAVKFEKKP